MSDSEPKKLSELRVVDLRAELEKRGLDKNGVKQVLFDRLKEAIEKEGRNPDNYVFELGDKKRRSSVQNTEEDKTADNFEEKMETEETNEQTTESEEKKQNEAGRGTEEKREEGEKTGNKPNKTEKSGKKTEENDGHESPIRLTLEDDEEALHDDEGETTDKTKDNSSKDKKKETLEDTKTNEGGKEKDAETDENRRKTGEKLQKKVGAKSNPNVVWVSNVAQNTRASELKAALSACGKVTGAKVVVNARYPGSNCFGYVTMGSVEDVANVIAKLNNTELNGQIIKIEKFDQVRADQMRQMKEAKAAQNKTLKKDEKPDDVEKKEKKDDDKSDKKEDEDKTEKNEEKSEEKEDGKETEAKKQGRTKSKDGRVSKERKLSIDRSKHSDDEKSRSHTSRERGRSRERKHYRSRSRSRGRRPVLTFDKIMEERERQRLRERERALREESRRRHEEAVRQRKIESRQRSEAARLEREREKLRIEKEKIEREKAELVRMERERQRLEMEKIALEKLELERTLIRLEEDRRAAKRAVPAGGYREREEPFDNRKRPVPTDRHFDAPPPPRFEPPSVKPRELTPKKFSSSKESYSKSYDSKHLQPSYRDKHPRDYETPSMSGRPTSGPRDAPRDIVLPKGRDSRYVERERERDRDRSPHFRGSMRDERRPPIAELKPGLAMSRSDHVSRNEHLPPRNDHRYDAPNGKLKPAPPRFERNQSSWNGGTSKPFSGSSGPSKPWMRERDSEWKGNQTASNDRWNSGSQSNSSMGRPFSSSANSMAPVCPPPPGINSYSDNSRFEYSKSMNSVRKY